MIDLAEKARALTCPPKGILAADESNVTADKRLAVCGIEATSETRRKFRELFLDAPRIEEYLTGVILYQETLDQTDSDNISFPDLLHARGVMVGIKVDEGTESFPGSPKELITNGLIGLPERLATYVSEHQTDFTKWRAVVRIEGDSLPSSAALVENAKRLANYARLVQEAGMVPMVEPEVLYEGRHSLLKSREVLEKTLAVVMGELQEQAVDLSSVVLKTSMALSGKDTGRIDTPEEVARETLGALKSVVPVEIPGIVFLSGGQEDDQATKNLQAIHELARMEGAPWNLTYSYARAIQEDALTAWKCIDENVPEARKAFLARLEGLKAAYGG